MKNEIKIGCGIAIDPKGRLGYFCMSKQFGCVGFEKTRKTSMCKHGFIDGISIFTQCSHEEVKRIAIKTLMEAINAEN
jgi:hypothetical protein